MKGSLVHCNFEKNSADDGIKRENMLVLCVFSLSHIACTVGSMSVTFLLYNFSRLDGIKETR